MAYTVLTEGEYGERFMKRFKVGTKVNVLGFDWNNAPTGELATVIRNRPNTELPPENYQRIRYEFDGGVCYAPIERLIAV